MFHVERDPIQEPAPQLRAPRHQVVNLRIDHLQRQRVRQRRRPAVSATVDSNLQPVAAVANPEPLSPPLV